MQRTLHMISVAGVGFLIASSPAFACACCTNTGQRMVETRAIGAYEAGVLEEIRFSGEAHLVTGEADVETIAGISARSSEFHVNMTRSGKTWTFLFSEGERRGTLTFEVPERMTRFEVDPREPGSAKPGGEPLLYKEWRITAKARSSGDLFGTARPMLTLILHGRGNSCTDATQFNAWTLVSDSPAGVTTLYGPLVGAGG